MSLAQDYSLMQHFLVAIFRFAGNENFPPGFVVASLLVVSMVTIYRYLLRVLSMGPALATAEKQSKLLQQLDSTMWGNIRIGICTDKKFTAQWDKFTKN